MHLCFPDQFVYRLVKPLLLYVIGKTGRRVVRIHSGTQIECNYALSSCGIKLDDIPMTYTGKIKTLSHKRWMKVRKLHDEFIKQKAMTHVYGDYRNFYTMDNIHKVQQFPGVYCPEVNCVLFHTNGFAWDFPGNIKFRDLIESLPNKQDENENEDLIDTIIRISLSEKGFQFMLYDEENYWYTELVHRDEIRKYVGFALRGHLRRCKAQNQRQFILDNSSTSSSGGFDGGEDGGGGGFNNSDREVAPIVNNTTLTMMMKNDYNDVGMSNETSTTFSSMPSSNNNYDIDEYRIVPSFTNMDGKTSGVGVTICGGKSDQKNNNRFAAAFNFDSL